MKLRQYAQQQLEIDPFSCRVHACKKRRIVATADYFIVRTSRFLFFVCIGGPVFTRFCDQLDPVEHFRMVGQGGFCLTQNVNQRLKMILQIKHGVLRFSHRPKRVENHAVEPCAGGEPSESEREQRRCRTRLRKLQHA